MIVPLFVGAREVDSRARGGDEERQADPARDAEERRRRRSGDRRDLPIGTLATVLQLLKLPDGTVKVLVEGVARAAVRNYARADDFFEAEAEALADDPGNAGRGRGARPLGRLRVRELREAQQEGLARDCRRRHPDRGLLEARRHRRLASRGEDRRQAGGAGDAQRRRAGWRSASR